MSRVIGSEFLAGTSIGARPSTIRQVNRSILLSLVRLHQPISRVALSKRTGIFRSSISAIVDELLAEGLLVERQTAPQGRGRVPVHLFLNDDGLRVLGVSIRPFTTRVASAGLSGKIGQTVSFPTPRRPALLLKELAKAIERIGGSFREVGISVPGLVNSETGQILMTPALPSYAGFAIADEVGRLAGVKATAENDCNTGALAELWLNEREVAGLNDFVSLEIGDVGVGAGIVLGGELYGGHDRTWVGEYGHMVVDPSGPRCECGRRGCWELYVSDRATWQRYAPDLEYTPLRFDRLIQAAREGDPRAVKTFLGTAQYLSLGLSNIVLTLNPQRIVLAGEITRVWEVVQETVYAAWAAAQVRICVYPSRSTLDELSLQGAVALALRRIFASPRLGS